MDVHQQARPTSISCYRYSFSIIVFDCLEGTGILGLLILLRIYALYDCTRQALAFSILLWCIYVIPATTISIVSAVDFFRAGTNILYDPVVDTCVMTEKPPYLWTIWVGMVAFESVIFVMIALKTWHNTHLSGHTSLITTIFRDGVLYFGVMLSGEIVNLVTFLAMPAAMSFFAVYVNWCFASLAVSRLYLNLRKTADPYMATFKGMATRPSVEACRQTEDEADPVDRIDPLEDLDHLP